MAIAIMFMPALAYDNSRLQYLRSPQGKVAELRQELNSGGKKDKNHSAKKIALKKIVANMTMSNNDMVALFPDIVNCMQIPSLEIKKMLVRHARLRNTRRDRMLTADRCFLYLVNYARIKPDVALKALPIIVQVRILCDCSPRHEAASFDR
jgi:AP-2 complex subunit beta-1